MSFNDVIIKALRRGFEVDDRDQFTNCALVFAYNGTGKTRLSYDFAHFDRGEGVPQHTLTTMPTPRTYSPGTTIWKITPTII